MTTDSSIRVMIVDDHAIMRTGLRFILEQSEGIEVVGQAADADESVGLVVELEPDVVVMDILMPGRSGVEACREILERRPQTRVLILTASNAEDAVLESVSAGATGYLQKYSDIDRLLSAIRAVANGEFHVEGEAARRVFAGAAGGLRPSASSRSDDLTARETEILRMFLHGMSYAEIGEARGNRPHTVRNAVYNIQTKLGIKTKQELGVWAARSGFLDLS